MIAPSDYCVLNGDPNARLSDIERLTLVGEAGLDRVIARFARQFSSLSLGGLAPNLTIEALELALSECKSLGIRPAFARPTALPSPSIVPIHGFADGQVLDASFTSGASIVSGEPVSEEALTANKTVHVRLWEHEDRSRPTIVAVHGWSMGDQKVNSLAFLPGLFYSLGYHVAIIELPFHGKRSVSKVGQVQFPNLDVRLTSSVIEQIVSDLRSTTIMLSERGHSRFGCIGLSLGAYAGALWASLDKLSFGVFIVPLASLGDLSWDLAVSRFGKQALIERGLSRAKTRALYFPHSALSRPSATPENSLLVIAGRGDKIVPRHQVTLLRKRWPNAQLEWVSGGHAAHFRKGQSLTIILEFLKRIDSLGE